MTKEEAIQFLSQIMDALLASNSWLPSTDNPIKESFGMAIKALTAQPEPLVKESRPLVKDLVKDTISRQAAIDALDKEYRCTDKSDDWDGLKTAMLIIENLPPAQPKHDISKANFLCPICGAEMEVSVSEWEGK